MFVKHGLCLIVGSHPAYLELIRLLSGVALDGRRRDAIYMLFKYCMLFVARLVLGGRAEGKKRRKRASTRRRWRSTKWPTLSPSRMTLESFLPWEERQELRYEFDGFRPIAMTGGTFAHAQIQFRLLRAL